MPLIPKPRHCTHSSGIYPPGFQASRLGASSQLAGLPQVPPTTLSALQVTTWCRHRRTVHKEARNSAQTIPAPAPVPLMRLALPGFLLQMVTEREKSVWAAWRIGHVVSANPFPLFSQSEGTADDSLYCSPSSCTQAIKRITGDLPAEGSVGAWPFSLRGYSTPFMHFHMLCSHGGVGECLAAWGTAAQHDATHHSSIQLP